MIKKCQFYFWTLIYKISGILRYKGRSWQSEILMLSEILMAVALQCLFPESSSRFLPKANNLFPFPWKMHPSDGAETSRSWRPHFQSFPGLGILNPSLPYFGICSFSESVLCVSQFYKGKIFPMWR